MADDEQPIIKIFNINLSLKFDDDGNMVNISNEAPSLTRHVLIEKYVVKRVEFEVAGNTFSGLQSIYEEPYSSSSDNEEPS